MDTATPPLKPAIFIRLLAVSLCSLSAGAAQAEEGWAGSLGLSSDYVYRGVSLSDNRASVLADGHYHAGSDWYAGLSAASAERATDHYSAAAINVYLGQGWALGEDWSSSVSLRHYDQAGGEQRALYRYDELSASLAWRHNVFLSVAAAPNIATPSYYTKTWYYYGKSYVYYYPTGSRRGPGYSYELVFSQALPWPSLSANAGLGYRDLKNLADVGYVYGSAGLAWNHGPWTLALSRIGSGHDADQLCCGNPAVNRWVGSASWAF